MTTFLALQKQKPLDIAPAFGTQVSSFSAIKKADNTSIKKTDVWKLDVNKLVYSPSYDVRLTANPDYYEQPGVQQTLQGIAADILADNHTDAISISFIDGNPVVVGGFKLYHGAIKARDTSGETIFMPVILAGKNAKEVMLSNLKRNRIDAYTQVELGILYKSLLEEGMCERELMEAYSVTKVQIRAAIETLSLPEDVQHMIVDRKISTHQWNDMVNNYGETEALDVAFKALETEGKVTKKTVKKVEDTESPEDIPQSQPVARKSKSMIYQSLTTVVGDIIPQVKKADIDTNGNSVVSLSPEQVKMLLQLEADIQG